MPYQVFKNSTRNAAAYTLRQYFAHNLTDRLSSYPAPTFIEKCWFAYQLLAALEQAHGKGIIHGDVKSENVMVTTWNWLLLTDFSPYKPTFLPGANDVAVLYYFFEPHKGRSGCCIAPERFVRDDSAPVTIDRRLTITERPVSLAGGRPSMPSASTSGDAASAANAARLAAVCDDRLRFLCRVR